MSNTQYLFNNQVIGLDHTLFDCGEVDGKIDQTQREQKAQYLVKVGQISLANVVDVNYENLKSQSK